MNAKNGFSQLQAGYLGNSKRLDQLLMLAKQGIWGHDRLAAHKTGEA